MQRYRGDGYGDNAAGNNGDALKFDPTQWSDFDGDGYGDNNGTGAINGDTALKPATLPTQYHGCPDTDGDGFVDPKMHFHKTRYNGQIVTRWLW